MLSLDKDLQLKKKSLDEFISLAKRILDYVPNVLSGKEQKGQYIIYYSTIAGTKKFVRPINENIFINSSYELANKEAIFRKMLSKLKNKEVGYTIEEENAFDSFSYTLIQSIGMALDLLVDPNSSRKHVGNRFEELMRVIFTEVGVYNKRSVYRLPYDTPEGTKYYICENDLILSPDSEMFKSTDLEAKEVIVSVKTTSKDRMGKMFIDKILLEKFAQHPLKVVGIFLNDVQRKQDNNISYTLVSGLFMVYNKFLTELEGVYYLDPPPNALLPPYNNYIKPFSKLFTEDISKILAS